MKYFLAFRQERDRRIVFVSGTKLSSSIEKVLHTLELPLSRKIPQIRGFTNAGPKGWPAWAQLKFNELFAADENECRELFARASAESDADFAERTADSGPVGRCKNSGNELATLGRATDGRR